MAICVAIIAGGPALLMYKDEIVQWLATKGYKCPKCGHDQWAALSGVNDNTTFSNNKTANIRKAQLEQNSNALKQDKPRIKLINKNKIFNFKEIDINNSKVLKRLKALAEVNNGGAENKLANMYYKGLDVDKNYSTAFYWANIAAQKGNRNSQILLSVMYKNGFGVEVDESLANFWLKQSNKQELDLVKKNKDLLEEDISELLQANEIILLAKKDDGSAENRVGQIYYAGIQTKTNYVKAFYYSKIAAEKGNKDAQLRLYSLYKNGWGTVRNEELATFWLNKSKGEVFDLLEKSQLNWLDISELKQIKEIRLLAKKDDGSAENRIGQIYYAGIQTKKNYVKAFYYSKIAAEKGNKDAQLRLYSLYKNGWGTVRNEELATFWLEKSREK